VSTGHFLITLADDQIDSEFAITKWLISSGHVDAKKEFGILLDGDLYVTILELLRLVEIGELANIGPEEAYIMWTKEATVYTTQ
jgi:hypothetical protein